MWVSSPTRTHDDFCSCRPHTLGFPSRRSSAKVQAMSAYLCGMTLYVTRPCIRGIGHEGSHQSEDGFSWGLGWDEHVARSHERIEKAITQAGQTQWRDEPINVTQYTRPGSEKVTEALNMLKWTLTKAGGPEELTDALSGFGEDEIDQLLGVVRHINRSYDLKRRKS